MTFQKNNNYLKQMMQNSKCTQVNENNVVVKYTVQMENGNIYG